MQSEVLFLYCTVELVSTLLDLLINNIITGMVLSDPVYVCRTTAAAVPPAAEERCVSDPNPGSATRDAAAPKTESLEPNKETQPAPSTSQESGECPLLAKQERTGTRRTRLTRVHSDVHPSAASQTVPTHPSTSQPPAGLHIHLHLPACRRWLPLSILCPFLLCLFVLLGTRAATLICFVPLYICNVTVWSPFV